MRSINTFLCLQTETGYFKSVNNTALIEMVLISDDTETVGCIMSVSLNAEVCVTCSIPIMKCHIMCVAQPSGKVLHDCGNFTLGRFILRLR